MIWFGTHFGPICDDTEQVPVPVGLKCSYCEEPIGPADSGVAVPTWSEGSEYVAIEHHECFLRQLVGSVGHQFRACSCYGKEDTSEQEMTRREAAIRARDTFLSRWPAAQTSFGWKIPEGR
jgi:hypothetical protein